MRVGLPGPFSVSIPGRSRRLKSDAQIKREASEFATGISVLLALALIVLAAPLWWTGKALAASGAATLWLAQTLRTYARRLMDEVDRV